jgi:speckle-type POZ protein
MQGPCIELTAAARSVQLFKINGNSATKEIRPVGITIASTTTNVGEHDWTIDYRPTVLHSHEYWIMFRITLASDDEAAGGGVAASFECRVVDQTGRLEPSAKVAAGGVWTRGMYKDVLIMSRNALYNSGYIMDDSVVVECAITVLLDQPADQSEKADAAAVADNNNVSPGSAAAPSYDLCKHFGELLRSKKGVDVTFVVAGEPVTAHKCVLAARSPVFMAELFGDMKENASSPRVEVEDMEADVFRALIKFIYTDTVPELDADDEDARTMAQHLLAAADRYGMERLKLICEDKVCGDVSAGTAAESLVLAEQHGCPKLKARCMEFIVATPANLRAVAAAEGYEHLMASCPSLLSELLLAVVQKYK